jgi:hypothetical protein
MSWSRVSIIILSVENTYRIIRRTQFISSCPQNSSRHTAQRHLQKFLTFYLFIKVGFSHTVEWIIRHSGDTDGDTVGDTRT